jgi:hypothetical protein
VNSELDRNRSMEHNELKAWLSAEDSGDDVAADAAFAHLFAGLPRVEPRPSFVDEAVTVALTWRLRRRRQLAVAWATAGAVLLVAVAVTAYFASPLLARGTVKTIAFVSGRLVPWLVAYASVALHGWLTLGHVGAVIAGALMTPARVAALVGVELVGLLAFYALHRLAGAERLGDAQV